jgi:hypothetical protein
MIMGGRNDYCPLDSLVGAHSNRAAVNAIWECLGLLKLKIVLYDHDEALVAISEVSQMVQYVH